MHVIRARSAGFCMGVSLALRALDEEVAALAARRRADPDSGGVLVTLGPIIHNPLVIDEYTARGVVCDEHPEGLTARDRVVIRAHGIPREVEESIAATGAGIRDATCPKVKKAQTAIARQTEQGGTLLLFGESDHPEVRGLVSYAASDTVVFGTCAELETLPLTPEKHYFLAAQTTQDRNQFLQARDILVARLGRDLPVLDTICDATRRRQNEVIELACRVEALVVVGGRNSGNTRRLAEVARTCGIPAIHVEQAGDFPAGALAGKSLVGLTAGASTPESHIHAMERYLSALEDSAQDLCPE